MHDQDRSVAGGRGVAMALSMVALTGVAMDGATGKVRDQDHSVAGGRGVARSHSTTPPFSIGLATMDAAQGDAQPSLDLGTMNGDRWMGELGAQLCTSRTSSPTGEPGAPGCQPSCAASLPDSTGLATTTHKFSVHSSQPRVDLGTKVGDGWRDVLGAQLSANRSSTNLQVTECDYSYLDTASLSPTGEQDAPGCQPSSATSLPDSTGLDTTTHKDAQLSHVMDVHGDRQPCSDRAVLGTQSTINRTSVNLQVTEGDYDNFDAARRLPTGEPRAPGGQPLSATSLLDNLLARTRVLDQKLDRMTGRPVGGATARRSEAGMARSASAPSAVLGNCLAQAQALLSRMDKMSTKPSQKMDGPPATRQVHVGTGLSGNAPARLPVGGVATSPLLAKRDEVTYTEARDARTHSATFGRCLTQAHTLLSKMDRMSTSSPQTKDGPPMTQQVHVGDKLSGDASARLPVGGVASDPLAATSTRTGGQRAAQAAAGRMAAGTGDPATGKVQVCKEDTSEASSYLPIGSVATGPLIAVPTTSTSRQGEGTTLAQA